MTDPEDHLLDGLTARTLETGRLAVAVIERDGDDPETPLERTVVFLHDALASSLLWQDLLAGLPADVRGIAVDLRGFGGSENLPVDATRGVRDFSDDLHATLETLGLPTAHLVGWGLGGAVALQYALDHSALSLSLLAPVSPFGFGGTRRDGTRLTEDAAGTGAGLSNPEFVRRLIAHDTTDEAEASPRTLIRRAFVAEHGTAPREDTWVGAVLATSTASGNYPGDQVPSDSWPGFAAGTTGVLNAVSPRWFDVSGIVALDPKPPILWVHGELDAVVSDTSFFDVNHLGALGVTPDWPGDEIAPAQPMVSQTRDVLAAYAAAGGDVREVALAGVGHTPHLEQPAEVRRSVLERVGFLGPHTEPAPDTEQIILKSTD
ncbi:MAG: alpha/beta fold hydrolase [Microbacterium sp.]|uniref:alpha/beta hydrolase n=1 Tax=Microbacterium sp. TaxID=51671 RepID=UPI002631428D|nr:alpha/beta fold hydrolase [Microbacterium sp.]MCX6503112.1 alpha/beta fold hydrolase [Microbacterium sp.]